MDIHLFFHSKELMVHPSRLLKDEAIVMYLQLLTVYESLVDGKSNSCHYKTIKHSVLIFVT